MSTETDRVGVFIHSPHSFRFGPLGLNEEGKLQAQGKRAAQFVKSGFKLAIVEISLQSG